MTHAYGSTANYLSAQVKTENSLPFLLKKDTSYLMLHCFPVLVLSEGPRTCCLLSGISPSADVGFVRCTRAGGEQGRRHSLCIPLALAQAAGCVAVAESQHRCSRLLICFSKNSSNTRFLKKTSLNYYFFKHGYVIFLTPADRFTYLELLVLFGYFFTAPPQLNNLSSPTCIINTPRPASSICSCHSISQSNKILI